jgi:hypothetical protein
LVIAYSLLLPLMKDKELLKSDKGAKGGEEDREVVHLEREQE